MESVSRHSHLVKENNMQVEIKSVQINNFRNLSNVEYKMLGSTVFLGNNRLGKTNVLNAIMWCLTGYDVFGNCKDLLNVPNSMKVEDGDTVVDVTVNLSTGSITRRCTLKKGSYSQSIAINGLDADTLKAGETQIDMVLGISGLVTTGSKDFNVRRFLLNPLYFTQCKESAFRDFIIKQLVDVDVSQVLDQCPAVIKDTIGSGDIAVISQNNDKDIKAVKKDIEYWSVIKDYCTKYNKELVNDLALANKVLAADKSKLAELTDKGVAIDKYAIEVSKIYDSACKKAFNGIDIVLLEKGQGEDAWKNTCYINSPITNARMDYCSTSEAIISGCSFLCAFIDKYFNVPHLPLIFDELETLDNNSLEAIINRTNTQLIAAKVESGFESIVVRGF